jgi:hypothetical protein
LVEALRFLGKLLTRKEFRPDAEAEDGEPLLLIGHGTR